MPDYMIQGLVPAVVTPFSDQGDIMFDAFDEIIQWHMSWGATGFLVAGDNGEQWALNEGELSRIAAAAMKATKGQAPVFVGCGAVTMAETVRRARAVAEGGATGVAVTQPFVVMNATDRELIARFEAVAKAVELPIMLFNTIQRSGFTVTHDVLESLLDVSPIVAIKQSNPNLAFVTESLHRFRDRLAIFVGNGTNMLAGRMLGSAGFISTGPDLLGEDIQRILNVETLSIPDRLELQYRVHKIFNVMLANVPGVQSGMPGPATDPAPYKAALNMLGLPAGVPRDPVQPATKDVEDRVRGVLDELGIIERETARRRAAQ